MRRIVITHFYNEAYLLDWWLRHHLKYFDHGVLIDYHSSDDSVAICKRIAPDWEIVTSSNRDFSGIMCDFEVMLHERRFPNCWKIALNTTEFLVAPRLGEMERLLIENDFTGVRIPGAIMVDDDPRTAPAPDCDLVVSKSCGIWECDFDFKAVRIPGLTFPTRNRLYHRFDIGAYEPGRHASHLPGQINGSRDFAAIYWYGFSPWTRAFKKRKLDIDARRAAFDRKHRMGVQHEAREADLDLRWSTLLAHAHDLRGGIRTQANEA